MEITRNTYYTEGKKITPLKRKRAEMVMPMLIHAMKSWSVVCACRKVGLHYQSYIYTLKEFEEFNIALDENKARQKRARM